MRSFPHLSPSLSRVVRPRRPLALPSMADKVAAIRELSPKDYAAMEMLADLVLVRLHAQHRRGRQLA